MMLFPDISYITPCFLSKWLRWTSSVVENSTPGFLPILKWTVCFLLLLPFCYTFVVQFDFFTVLTNASISYSTTVTNPRTSPVLSITNFHSYLFIGDLVSSDCTVLFLKPELGHPVHLSDYEEFVPLL